MIQKTVFYEEIEQGFYHFRKCLMKILFGDCNEQVALLMGRLTTR